MTVNNSPRVEQIMGKGTVTSCVKLSHTIEKYKDGLIQLTKCRGAFNFCLNEAKDEDWQEVICPNRLCFGNNLAVKESRVWENTPLLGV